MAGVTTAVPVTNAAHATLLGLSGSRRSYVIYNPGPLACDIFANTQVAALGQLLAGGTVTASVANGDTMDTIKAQLVGGAGPQNINATSF